jgi:hypothetical protein
MSGAGTSARDAAGGRWVRRCGRTGLAPEPAKSVVPKVGSTAPWGALEVGTSERVVRLFTIEVTLDKTLGNWYPFIKSIHRIRNLLTVKCY